MIGRVEIVARRRPRFALAALRARAEGLLAASGVRRRVLSVLLTGDREVRALNRKWRRIDAATDVLSFPAPAGELLGDLAISLETAARQARAERHSVFTEVTILVAHGLLHLLGYDHEASAREAARMLRRERMLLRRIGVERDALTARGTVAKRRPRS